MKKRNISMFFLLSLLMSLPNALVAESCSVKDVFSSSELDMEPNDGSHEALTRRKVKKICKLCVDCFAVTGRAFIRGVELLPNADGTFGGATGATGATGAPGTAGAPGAVGPTGPAGATFIGSLVPMSSGLVTLATLTGALLPDTGVVMGFGSSTLQDTVDPTVASPNTGYAFTVPADGSLHDLFVSVDGVYPVGITAAPFTFTYTLLLSSGVDGTLSTYEATDLSAEATLTPQPGSPFGVLTPGFTGTGSDAGSIPVAAGDRVVIQVTSDADIPAAALANVTFSAGVLYSPDAP